MLRWRRLVPQVVAALLACRSDHAAAARGSPTVTLLGRTDVEAYAVGTAAQIGLLRQALHAGERVTAHRLDSVATAATGVAAERFHAIAFSVETALKAHRGPIASGDESLFVAQAPRLDSLRIELMMLQLRAHAPE